MGQSPPLAQLARASLAAAAAAIATLAVAALFCPAAFDYAESDVATWIWLLRHHHDLYRPVAGQPFVGSNYPPLAMGLVAALAWRDDAILLAGRLVSLAALVVTSGVAGLTVARLRGSRAAGAGAALLLFAAAGYFAAVCRPDALGLACGAVAVTLCAFAVRGWPPASALLFAASLLCKHNLVAGPVGVALFAWQHDRRAAIVFTATLALLVGGAVVAGALFEPLVRWSLAGFSVARLARWLVYAVAPSLFGLIAVARALPLAPAGATPLAVWLRVLAVAAVTTLALGRAGASANYVLELSLALTIVGATLTPSSRLWQMHRLATALGCLALAGYHLAVALPRARDESNAARRWMASARGPTFAETSWYATQSGRAPLTIPFLATQLGRGTWSVAPLARVVERCDQLLLGFDLDAPDGWRAHADRLAPEVLAALRARHRYHLVDHVGGLYVYAPRHELAATTEARR